MHMNQCKQTIELTADGWFRVAQESFKRASDCRNQHEAEAHRQIARERLLRLSTVEIINDPRHK